jgi:hypothetical protein
MGMMLEGPLGPQNPRDPNQSFALRRKNENILRIFQISLDSIFDHRFGLLAKFIPENKHVS